LPPWMGLLVHANPVTYGVDLMRHAIGQPTTFATSLDLGVVVAFGALMVGAVMVWFRRE